MFKKLLIANRGEIAIRVARTARELGVASAAVYTDVDRESLHVRRADEAWPLGENPRAYLDAERLVDTAVRAGCDALHPGYGFLSENADFAELCAARGVTFVGPPSDAIRVMGEKQRARATMAAAGVPVVPGGSAETLDEARATAAHVGFPLLVKAANGGGGKGMRLVMNESELPSALERARSEAEKAFGSATVYIERGARRSAPRRGASPRRSRGHGRSPRRTRLLAPAPPPKNPRRNAVSRARSENARGALRGRAEGRPRHRLLLRRNLRISAGSQRQLLLSRDEHAPSGRAPDHRARHGSRPRSRDARGRSRRANFRRAARSHAEQRSKRASRPKTRRKALHRAPERSSTGVAERPWRSRGQRRSIGSRIGSDYDPLLSKICVWAPDRKQALRADAARAWRVRDHRDFRRTSACSIELLASPQVQRATTTPRSSSASSARCSEPRRHATFRTRCSPPPPPRSSRVAKHRDTPGALSQRCHRGSWSSGARGSTSRLGARARARARARDEPTRA